MTWSLSWHLFFSLPFPYNLKLSSTFKPRMELTGITSCTFWEVLLLQILLLVLIIQPHLSFSTLLARNETDRLSLLAFKSQISNDPFHRLDSWNESFHFCQWYGVTCGRRHERIVKLDLQSCMMEGSLTTQIGNLSFLRILNLENNSLSQAIPQELGRLSRLQEINLQNNMFTGQIPINISQCSNLLLLNLRRNNLTGKLLPQLGSLAKLQQLALSQNNLVGEIPTSFGNLSSLHNISASVNHLFGTIPDDIGKLKRLRTISLGENNLSGNIPPSIYNLSSLVFFRVTANQLTGSLPPSLGQAIPIIEIFDVPQNSFSGSIPTSVSNWSNLVIFEISFSSFTGKMPALERAQNLRVLAINDNNLGNGKDDDLSFLHPLANITSLEVLDAGINNLAGLLPEFLSNFSTKLEWLVISWNQLRGSIPAEIGNLVGLEELGFHANQLAGSIPSSIGRLAKLEELFLYGNRLSGIIPTSLGNITALSTVNIGSNDINGCIPSSLANCKVMRALNLYQNSLSGAIPKEVISSLYSLSELYLFENNLTGAIPSEIGKLVNLEVLYASQNRLSGEIPESLGMCISLEELDLGENLIEGKVPDSLSSLRGLQYLNLSHNHLIGNIPKFLGDIDLLVLDLSFNHFAGEVPTQGVFQNASAISLEGNTNLCGGVATLILPRCIDSNNKQTASRSSHKLKVIIVIACAILGVILVASFVAPYTFRKKHHRPASTVLSGIFLLKLSYKDLLDATERFSSDNLIGVGSFGSVYRGVLGSDGTVVAVKVLNLLRKGAGKSFMAECEALANIRHRNLVRVLTACSSIDFQGNDFKALVYEYMENGSLENWLHPAQISDQLEQSRCLTLNQRVSISIDIANALDYLNHHCQTPLVHCDLKPSNVLLDGDMIAHVGDFGMARSLPQESDHQLPSNPTSSIGIKGTIGYAAPEYGMGSEISTYGDVYSYGILLLEMFTGKRPTDGMFKEGLNLHNFVKTALPDNVAEVVDPIILIEDDWDRKAEASGRLDYATIRHKMILECLASILEIGVCCSSEIPADRMDIGRVAAKLHRIRGILLGNRGQGQHQIIVEAEGWNLEVSELADQ